MKRKQFFKNKWNSGAVDEKCFKLNAVTLRQKIVKYPMSRNTLRGQSQAAGIEAMSSGLEGMV